MPKDIRTLNPLTESEQFQLNRLLARLGENQAEALQRREKELALERTLQAKRDKLAAAEAKLSKRIAELRIDIDCVTAEIYKIAPSGIAFRHVAAKLQEYGERLPSFSFFNTSADNVDREQLQLLAEIALSMFEAATKPKGGRPSLREKMEGIKVEVGPDGPASAAPDDRSALAAAIVRAGRRRRGEEE